MKKNHKIIVLAGVLKASLGSVAAAQTPAPTTAKIDAGSPDSNKTNLSVTISSETIETSYKKVKFPLPAALNPLPDYCYKRDPLTNDFIVDTATGRRELNMSLNGPVRWADVSNGVYSIKCSRKPNGSIEVEGLALWDEYEGGPAQIFTVDWPFLNGPIFSPVIPNGGRWYGGGKWHANAIGFTNPNYAWTYSGGFPTQNFSDKVAAGTEYITTFAGRVGLFAGGYVDYGIELTADKSGSNLHTIQSVFKATVSDAVNPPLTNSYVVNWHPQYEKAVSLPDGPAMKHLFQFASNPAESDGSISFGNSISLRHVPAKKFDGLAAIDGVLVITKALGLPIGKAASLFEIFKVIVGSNKWEATAEAFTVDASISTYNDNTFDDAKANRPENFNSGGPITSEVDYKAYCYRVRTHHTQKSLADEYDTNGFHSGNHLFSVDITDHIGFELFFVGKDRGVGGPPEGDYDIAQSRIEGGIK